MSRKTMSFFQLIEYVAREGRAEGTPILQNLSADGSNLDKVNRAFMRNARHCPQRKNGVFLYHEILSLSPEDKPQTTPEILADLAERYLSLRAPGAMAWGMVHFDKNPHIHLVISANLRGQTKKLRLSRKEFSQVKRELEIYQKEKYPKLSRSIVFDDAGKKRPEVKEKTASEGVVGKPPEQERKKRLARQGRGADGRKEALRQDILEALTASGSPGAFTARLQQRDITLYERSGRPAGIISNNKKYRFKILGLEEAIETAKTRWERLPERKNTVRNIVAEKTRRLFRGFGFAQEIMGILDRRGSDRGGDGSRRSAIESILRRKRHTGKLDISGPDRL